MRKETGGDTQDGQCAASADPSKNLTTVAVEAKVLLLHRLADARHTEE